MTSTRNETDAREQTAAQLKRDGYNSSVVARKMITEHGMEEDEALALVGRLYGKTVSARSGDTVSAVVVGLSLVAGGAACLFAWAVNWEELGDFEIADGTLWIGFGAIGAGVTRIIIAMFNHGAKDDLRERRDGKRE